MNHKVSNFLKEYIIVNTGFLQDIQAGSLFQAVYGPKAENGFLLKCLRLSGTI
jgi:hypothetical protein